MRDYPAKRAKAEQPKADDLALWLALVEAAEATAAKPEKSGHIHRARKAVKGRAMPHGQAVAGSPFDRLSRMALAWVDMLIEQRLTQGPALGLVAAECRAVLAAHDGGDSPSPSQSGPGREPRADIYG